MPVPLFPDKIQYIPPEAVPVRGGVIRFIDSGIYDTPHMLHKGSEDMGINDSLTVDAVAYQFAFYHCSHLVRLFQAGTGHTLHKIFLTENIH